MAVASAGMANAVAMRYKEGVEGITIYDEQGNACGTSIAAGRQCLTQVALVRAALPVPILLLPPFILDAVRASSLGPAMAKSLPLRLSVELGIFACFLQGALPFAVALFPQKGSIAAADVEPQFQGKGVGTYYYNKGL
jgi:ribosomal protein S18 acetylase RimI-like enzyme